MTSAPPAKTPAPVAKIGVLEWFQIGEHDRVLQVLAELRELGVTQFRTGVSWADYVVDGGPEWYDWLMPTLAQELEVLPCFVYTPPSLGIRPKTSSPPRVAKDYADFLDVFITRHGEHFDWVELWNEPNNRTEYDFTLDYAWNKFGEMVGGAAYWAQQRGKKTVLGGMAPVDPNWLESMFEHGVMQYIDAVGMHGFPDVFDQLWDGWEVNVAALREVMDQHDCKAEIWITEAGFSTWQYDEYKQLQEFKQVCAAPVERVYWYSMHDLDLRRPTVGGFHVDNREYHFGLKRTDGSSKLLYRMWARHGIDGLHDLPHVRRDLPRPGDQPYVLITGGAGFVGTNLASRLLDLGQRVLVLDNLSRPGVERNLAWLHETYGSKLRVYIGDIRDITTVNTLVRHAQHIYHLAAQVAVTTSLVSPLEDFAINAQGTLNLLEAMRVQPNPPSLVFTSTNKVYGGLDDLAFVADGTRYEPTDPDIRASGISEARPLDFHSPYGCSKGTADQYVIDYARTYDLSALVLRMSCIYGPHQCGTEDQGWVAHFAISALEDRSINIYGDGLQVRDVLYVHDLVDAFLLAQKHVKRLQGKSFNIGGGPANAVSLLELIDVLAELKGSAIPLTFGDWRPGDQCYYVSDTRRFESATGWQPKHDVEEGVLELYNWLAEARGVAAEVATPAAVAPTTVAR